MGGAKNGEYYHMIGCLCSCINGCVTSGDVAKEKDDGNIMDGLVVSRDL